MEVFSGEVVISAAALLFSGDVTALPVLFFTSPVKSLALERRINGVTTFFALDPGKFSGSKVGADDCDDDAGGVLVCAREESAAMLARPEGETVAASRDVEADDAGRSRRHFVSAAAKTTREHAELFCAASRETISWPYLCISQHKSARSSRGRGERGQMRRTAHKQAMH